MKPVTVVRKTKDEDDSTAVARMSIRPVMRAASTLKCYERDFADVELADLVSVLEEQTTAAKEGDSGRAEAMLAAQAHTLDSIFHALARNAIRSGYLTQLEPYLKLALRAQSQCRATWETLSVIKHPPLANFVGQANITNGPQQVNNGCARGKNNKAQNELLEKQDGSDWLDTGKTSQTGGGNQTMAAVGEVNGAKNGRG